MKISLTKFGGILPRIDPRRLPPNAAQTAENVYLRRGTLDPIHGETFILGAGLGGSGGWGGAIPTDDDAIWDANGPYSIHPYNGTWIRSDQCRLGAEYVRCPVSDDQYERLYWLYRDYTEYGMNAQTPAGPTVRGVSVRQNNTLYAANDQVRWSEGDTVWKCTVAGRTGASAPSIENKGVGDTVTDSAVTWEMTATTLSGADTETYDWGVAVPTNTLTCAAQAKGSVTWARTWYYQYEEPDGTVSQSGNLREGNYSDTLENAAAVDKGGGKVGLPCNGHGFETDDTVIISGTTNYDGTYTVDSTSSTNEIVVTAAYVAETFAGTELVLGQVDEVTVGKQYRMHTLPAKSGASADADFMLYFKAEDADSNLLGYCWPNPSHYEENNDFYLSGAEGTGSLTTASTAPAATLDVTYDTSRASDYTVERYYVYCYYTKWGELGPPSAVSSMVAVDPTQDCNLTNLDVTTPSATSPITFIRIYRTVTSTAGTYYRYVDAVPFLKGLDAAAATNEGGGQVGIPCYAHGFTAGNQVTIAGTTNYDGTYTLESGTTADKLVITAAYVAETFATTDTATAASYLDSTTDADCGDILPSVETDSGGRLVTDSEWDGPIEGWRMPVALPNGVIACFHQKTVYFSEPYQPHAFPRRYGVTVEYDIMGLGVNSSGLVVLTKGYPYLIMGSHPSDVILERLDTPQACASTESISVIGDATTAAVIYASPDGLVMIDGAVVRLFTTPFYDRANWQALTPSEMIGSVYNGRYHGFTSQGNIVFDLSDPQPTIVTRSYYLNGLYTSLEDGILYGVAYYASYGWCIVSLETAAGHKTVTWKSKRFVFSRRGSFSCYRVRAAAYHAGDNTLQLKLYAAGALVSTINVTSGTAGRIPTLRDETDWEIEVVANNEVYEVLVSTSMADL
jgi:hypothetical protein